MTTVALHSRLQVKAQKIPRASLSVKLLWDVLIIFDPFLHVQTRVLSLIFLPAHSVWGILYCSKRFNVERALILGAAKGQQAGYVVVWRL